MAEPDRSIASIASDTHHTWMFEVMATSMIAVAMVTLFAFSFGMSYWILLVWGNDWFDRMFTSGELTAAAIGIAAIAAAAIWSVIRSGVTRQD